MNQVTSTHLYKNAVHQDNLPLFQGLKPTDSALDDAARIVLRIRVRLISLGLPIGYLQQLVQVLQTEREDGIVSVLDAFGDHPL